MAIRGTETAPLIVTRARVVALLYLILIALPVFGGLYVSSRLVVPGDVESTARNILASESLFRLGIVSTLLGHLVTDILWVLLLYQLLRPIDRSAASLMIILSLLGVPISLLNELNHVAVLLVLHGADAMRAFSPAQANALVSLFLDLHDKGIEIAEIFWGLWLFPYGYLVFKSGFLPRIFGVLLMSGCFGYLVPSLAGFLWPNLQASLGSLPGLSSLGELLVPIWLVIRGVGVAKWEKSALANA
jgi:hypothetical protein